MDQSNTETGEPASSEIEEEHYLPEHVLKSLADLAPLIAAGKILKDLDESNTSDQDQDLAK